MVGRLSGLRILVADDARNLVRTADAMFTSEGAVVTCVYSGSELFDTVRESDPRAPSYDFLFTDNPNARHDGN